MIRLGPLESTHIPTCVSIISRNPFFKTYDLDAKKLRQTIKQNLTHADHIWYGAFSANQLTGFAWLVRRGAFNRSHYLRLIAVDPDYQRKKVGQLLMDQLEKELLTPCGIMLLCNETNNTARSFYRARGYQDIGTLPNYIIRGQNEVIMCKQPRGKLQ